MKISIITVCFNSIDTIENTIKSVLTQNYNNIEYIVIDGNSTDGTLGILSNYQNQISRLISEPDNGIYDAMNKGIKQATGSVIGFLNSDDVYANDNIISMISQTMQSKDTMCCFGDLEYFSESNPKKTVRRWKSCSYQNNLFQKGWHPPHPTFFAKKWAFEKYGTFDINYHIGADYELMLRFLHRHKLQSQYIPHVLVKMMNGGKSNRNLFQIIKANIECYNAWKKNGLKINPFFIIKKPASKLIQFINNPQ